MRDRAAEALLVETVALLWQHGWQPAEVHRQLRVSVSAAAGRLQELRQPLQERRQVGLLGREIAAVAVVPL